MLDNAKPGSPLELEGLPPSGLAYALAQWERSRPVLVVVHDDERAEAVVRDLRAFGLVDATLFPGEPHVPFEDVSIDPAVTAARLALRARWRREGRPRITVVSVASLQSRWIEESVFRDASVLLRPGEDIDREVLARTLVRAG
ncbi:MAG: hypothetical protein AAF658_00580, partial [Myxococcota bacterium]